MQKTGEQKKKGERIGLKWWNYFTIFIIGIGRDGVYVRIYEWWWGLGKERRPATFRCGTKSWFLASLFISLDWKNVVYIHFAHQLFIPMARAHTLFLSVPLLIPPPYILYWYVMHFSSTYSWQKLCKSQSEYRHSSWCGCAKLHFQKCHRTFATVEYWYEYGECNARLQKTTSTADDDKHWTRWHTDWWWL